jgi:hypothetical protein
MTDQSMDQPSDVRQGWAGHRGDGPGCLQGSGGHHRTDALSVSLSPQLLKCCPFITSLPLFSDSLSLSIQSIAWVGNLLN